jgi:ATP-dependent Clp protease adaptor protein ClpS
LVTGTEKKHFEDIAESGIQDLVNLIVHNDDVNTFDWVIQSLIEICKHTQEQAEQCALIIHTGGRYCVKSGPEIEIKPMKEALVDRGISATIEKENT